MKYRKKPVVVEAYQWHLAYGETDVVKRDIDREDLLPRNQHKKLYYINTIINTIEGKMAVSDDDWIIEDARGNFSVCEPDMFNETYEPVEETK